MSTFTISELQAAKGGGHTRETSHRKNRSQLSADVYLCQKYLKIVTDHN